MKRLTIVLTLWIMAISAEAQISAAIRVEKKGAGNPVLLLPGFACSGSVWQETIAQLAGANEYHIVSYAGFNGIASIEMPWYQTIREALLLYIRQEGWSKVTIVGHSMGGNLAVSIAAEMPNTIQKLVLVDAIPCMREMMMPGVTADQIQYDNPYNTQMLNMTKDSMRQHVTRMAENMTFREDKVDMLVQWMLQADRQTFVYGYTDLLKLDLRDKLDKIEAQTIILGASFPDDETVYANFQQQYANLKNKTIKIAPNSKHFVMFDQPEWFYNQINAFLVK